MHTVHSSDSSDNVSDIAALPIEMLEGAGEGGIGRVGGFGLAGGASVGGGIDGVKRGVSEGIELTGGGAGGLLNEGREGAGREGRAGDEPR